MPCQIEAGSGTARATSAHDLINKVVSFRTSRHVATVVINNGGTGGTYVVGDIVTLTHAGAHLDAKFEVLTVSAGQILTMRIHSSGAFGDRVNGSVTISAGGTGYAVGDIIELDSGSSRCKAKLQVDTLSGSAVATASLFEDLGTGGGGVYSTLPTYPSATTAVGPDGAAGTGCTITMGGSTGIIGTTGLAVTGGGGTGATVDITLAETGWTVDSRNTNDRTINSIDNEKSVVLVGDATGWTNKPFTALLSGTATSGLDTRHFILSLAMIAHNPGLDLSVQTGRSPGLTDETTFAVGGSYILCSQDTGAGTDEMDFWMKADDLHFSMITQLDENAAVSDNGIYIQHYAGLLNRIGTETESPYPIYTFGSSRAFNIDPTVGSDDVTSLTENRMQGTGCGWVWDNGDQVYKNIQNDNASGTPTFEEIICTPCGRPRVESSNTTDKVVAIGTLQMSLQVFELDRGATVLVLRKIPGTVDEFFLWPLTLRRQDSSTPSAADDRLYGQLRGVFWIEADDGTGNRIVNFSEDYVTVSGDRYLVFHNHTHTSAYQYLAWKWDT
jgi:hypothetical protein